MTRTVTLAPDVGTLVTYRERDYRVSGWLRPAEPPAAAPGDFSALLDEILFESCREIQGHRLVHCTRERATHLSLSGVGGAIARIEDCRVEGKVSWSEAQLAEARGAALRSVGRMVF